MYSGYLLYHKKNYPQLRGLKQHFVLFVILWVRNSQRAWLGSSSLNHMVSAETAGAGGSLPRWHLVSCLQPSYAWLLSLSFPLSQSLSLSLLPHPWHLTLKDTSPDLPGLPRSMAVSQWLDFFHSSWLLPK